MKSGTPPYFPIPALAQIERAVQELRRGLPLVIFGAGNVPEAVMASELVNAQGIEGLCKMSSSTPDILLTHNRANTLKIRLYTPDAVAIPLPDKDRLGTIHHLADPTSDLDYPLSGPFNANRNEMSPVRLGALKLAKLSGLLPSVLATPVDAAQAAPLEWAGRQGLIALDLETLEAYEAQVAHTMAQTGVPIPLDLEAVSDAQIPLKDAEKTKVFAFRPGGAGSGGPEHLAIRIGDVDTEKPVLVRMHSECFTGDLLGSLKCDCGQQLRGAIQQIAKAGSGILLYLAQEGRGIGLMNKLRAYHLQDQGFDTIDANLRLGFDADERLFDAAAEILKHLGVQKVHLLTNNPDKVAQLEKYGVEVAKRVAHTFPSNKHNEHYLAVKADKSGHIL